LPLFGRNLIPKLLQSGRPGLMHVCLDRSLGLLAYNATNASQRLFLTRIILTKVPAPDSISLILADSSVMMECHMVSI